MLSIENLNKLNTKRLLALLKSVRKKIRKLESNTEMIFEIDDLKKYKQSIKEILYFREDV